jgi:hypothetical protein
MDNWSEDQLKRMKVINHRGVIMKGRLSRTIIITSPILNYFDQPVFPGDMGYIGFRGEGIEIGYGLDICAIWLYSMFSSS